MITVIQEGKAVLTPEDPQEAKLLAGLLHDDLQNGLLDRISNPPELHITFGKTEYVVNRHYNPNGKEYILWQFVETIMDQMLKALDKY